MAIQRGDIYRFNLEPAKGSEQQGNARPCIVLSVGAYNDKLPTVSIVPLTSAPRRELPPIVVSVPSAGRENSMAFCNQGRVVDKSRIVGKLLGKLSIDDLQKIETGVKRYLGL